jgi:hypothetical protein
MPKKKDPARENRIINEVIVDCYDEIEEMMGWYYYMNDTLQFPVKADVRLQVKGGGTEIIAVEIVEIDPKSETGQAVRLGVVEAGSKRVQYVSPEAIVRLNTSAGNKEVINDWLYWHDFDLVG